MCPSSSPLGSDRIVLSKHHLVHNFERFGQDQDLGRRVQEVRIVGVETSLAFTFSFRQPACCVNSSSGTM